MDIKQDWQLRRSEFNHKWLKNSLLSALDSAANFLHGKITGVGYLEDIMQEEVAEWPKRAKELDTLVNDFEEEMSPKKIFETLPFCDWDIDEISLLADFLHELWLSRYQVRSLVTAVHDSAREVDKAFDRLLEVAPIQSNMIIDTEFTARFEAFRSACRALANTVERFPNKVLVI